MLLLYVSGKRDNCRRRNYTKCNGKVWQSLNSFPSTQARVENKGVLLEDTKLGILNTNVAEIWRGTKKIADKVEAFANQCQYCNLEVKWPNITDKDLWKKTHKERMLIQVSRKKWISHILRNPHYRVIGQAFL